MSDYYRSDGTDVFFEEIEDEFREMLNDSQPPYQIGYLTFEAGDILKEMDPIAFHSEVFNYIDAQMKDGMLFEENPELGD